MTREKTPPAGQRVNDGLWHSVSLDSRDLHIALGLDAEPPSTVELWQQLEPRGNIYFGGTVVFLCFFKIRLYCAWEVRVCFSVSGCPNKDCWRQTPTFQGCMRLVFINGQPVNLSYVQQGLLGNYNELKFDTCNIRDR